MKRILSSSDRSFPSPCVCSFADDKVVNGDKKEAEGSGGEEEVEDEPPANFYDKTKSFFDNISCEATERAKR